jgi:hypothetical protein
MFGSKSKSAVHSPARPYCDDLQCWCHSNASHHTLVQNVLATTDNSLLGHALSSLSGQEEAWCDTCYGVRPVGHNCYA